MFSKKKGIILCLALCLSICLMVPFNAEAAHSHKYANKNSELQATIGFYQKDGSLGYLAFYETTNIKSWTSPKKNFDENVIKKNALSSYKADKSAYTVLTKNYKKNGKNYKGYAALPFKVYGSVKCNCTTKSCTHVTYTKAKQMVKGIVFIKKVTKNGKTTYTTDIVYLSNWNSISIALSKKTSNGNSYEAIFNPWKVKY